MMGERKYFKTLRCSSWAERCISLVILDYPHSGPAGKSATLHINCFGRNLPHMRRCNSLSHSFPPTCISDMRAIVCGTDFSILISCILSKESHFQLQNFRNCILLGFRDILRCWEVFQCLQEDVFKPGKANYLSFKSWR